MPDGVALLWEQVLTSRMTHCVLNANCQCPRCRKSPLAPTRNTLILPQARVGSLHFGRLQRERRGYQPDLVGQCATTIPFIMDYKLGRVDDESRKYSSSRSLVLAIFPLMSLMVELCAQYVTSSSTWIRSVIYPSPSVMA